MSSPSTTESPFDTPPLPPLKSNHERRTFPRAEDHFPHPCRRFAVGGRAACVVQVQRPTQLIIPNTNL